MTDQPTVLINGLPIKTADPLLAAGDAESGASILTFKTGVGAPEPLYRIGSPVSVQFGEYGPSVFLVTGLDVQIEESVAELHPTFAVTLREVGPIPIDDDRARLLYGAVLQSIMHRVRFRALLDVLETKGVLALDEYDAKLIDVIDQHMVEYASEIVSLEDAEKTRELALERFRAQTSSTGDESIPSPR